MPLKTKFPWTEIRFTLALTEVGRLHLDMLRGEQRYQVKYKTDDGFLTWRPSHFKDPPSVGFTEKNPYAP